MNYLHLDKAFQPFGKTIAHEQFTFNGGEPHIKIQEQIATDKTVLITTRIRQFNDLGLLLLAVDALRRMRVQKLELFLPYFPAARQDRVMTTGEALSVKVYADLINTANFERVFILDPHSDVTPALLNNVEVIDNHHFVKACLSGVYEDYVLISPDAGAVKKIGALARFLGGKEIITCSKKRDVLTGKLSGFSVPNIDLKGKTGILVDDICDGGGTFIGLAIELKKQGIERLILIVTHGIFSRGFEELAEHYDAIYTTNSFADFEHEKLTQIKLDHGFYLNKEHI